MARITTEKYKTDWINGRNETVKTTKKEYPKSGYTQTTTITTKYSNLKSPAQSNIIGNRSTFQLSSPKITKSFDNPSIVTRIIYDPKVKTYQKLSSTSMTKIENLNYQSPYKKNILTDKSLNFNRNTYDSPYQHRLTYLSPLYMKSSPEIIDSKKNIVAQKSPNTYFRPTFEYKAKEQNSNGFIKLNNILPTTNPIKTSTPFIATNLIKVSSPDANKISSNIKTFAPLFAEDFHTKLNINDNKKKLGPGKLFIFNHDEFQNPSNEYREGSKCDVKLLEQTFKKYKVKVTLFQNYTVKKIKNQVEKIFKEDFSKTSCIVIAILSHGNRMERIAANDGSYSIHDDILFPILRNKTLEGKPKILIVQACKGDMDLREFKTDSSQINTKPLIPDEIYKFYSTSEGFVSYRNTEGSIFIKAFCEELEKCGSEKPIRDIMESAIKIIKFRTSGQQIPSMCVNNTEPYIFGKHC